MRSMTEGVLPKSHKKTEKPFLKSLNYFVFADIASDQAE